jgi:3-hydroxyacyl-CoA dehydrogenase/enoyl-CoA hydratase/3-hydroxybutyryl-CoA epimerase
VSTTKEYFSLEREADGVAVLTVANPLNQPNTISRAFIEGLEAMLPKLEQDASIRGLVVISGKADWLVGADLKEIEELKTEEEVAQVHSRIRGAFDRCAALTYPTCAAVAGNAPGGGLEFSLIWRYRVLAIDPPAQLSQAEVNVGLIPGAGGTQRLPRLIGLPAALDLILTGKKVFPKKAVSLGLAEETVPEVHLKRAALELIRRHLAGNPPRKKGLGLKEQLWGTGPGRRLLQRFSSQAILRKSHGLYPAPEVGLDVTLKGWELPLDKALELEGKAFGPLVLDPVSRALRHLFHVTVALKKRNALEGTPGTPRPVDLLGIVGGGFMGSGIAQVSLDAGSNVYIRDETPAAIGRANSAVYSHLAAKARRGILPRHELSLVMGRLAGGQQSRGFAHAPLVIEAVFEDLPTKQRVLAEVEEVTQGRAIFASNTSSLSIADIAAHARYPANVIGMHFFSPVAKMPLLEVVVPRTASPETVATAVAYGRRLGKHVILVRDKVGFYTTRLVGTYLNEVSHVLMEGAPIPMVDAAVSELGFPVGPVQLLDEVGLDVGAKVNKILHAAYGDRLAPPSGWELLLSPGRLGRKSGRGLYLYQDGKRVGPDQSLYSHVRPRPGSPASGAEIQERALFVFIAEAIRCLEEGVVPGPVEGDAGAVFGLGFPPLLGGPFYYVDCLGSAKVLEKLRDLNARFGRSFTPPALLERMALGNERFYPQPVWAMGGTA